MSSPATEKPRPSSVVPLFTILSPVHNEEQFVAEMIRSVMRQRIDSWEIVFSDDGSTDQTATVIRTFADADPRIRIAHEGTRIGKNAALNAAFRASRGELLFLLAGDDKLPDDGLTVRLAAFGTDRTSYRSRAAFFKMRTMSTDPRFDGLVLPRGAASSRTGSSPTYTRDVANRIFPLPETLPSEDLWIGFLAEHLAADVALCTDVAWNYRIHPGNSNPRHRDFATMSKAIGERAEAWRLLQNEPRLALTSDALRDAQSRWELELLRRRGSISRILCHRHSRLVDRLGTAAAARPGLFALRMRFYRLFTGLRGA